MQYAGKMDDQFTYETELFYHKIILNSCPSKKVITSGHFKELFTLNPFLALFFCKVCIEDYVQSTLF